VAYTTSKSLLLALQSGDDVPWFEFFTTYRPLMIVCGNDYCLVPHELEELCQQVMLDIFKTSKTFRYNPQKGRFRDYLRQVIRRNAIDIIRRRGDQAEAAETAVDCAVDPMAAKWESEWRAHVLNQALVQLRNDLEPRTYQAFELYALKGEPPRAVAQFLGIPLGRVYLAKNRATAKLRRMVEQLQDI